MRLSRLLFCLALVVSAIALARGIPGKEGETVSLPILSKEVLSDVYLIDRKYPSMTGPSSSQGVRLQTEDVEELVWITGFQATMVDAGGEEQVAQEFMCHSNLDIDVQAHHQAFGANLSFNPRLFTLSQGQLAIDFPTGFGIPVLSTEVLDLTTQVLNHNLEGEGVRVRHKIQLDYVRQSQLKKPLTPLFPLSAYGLKLLSGTAGYFGVDAPDPEKHGPGCLPGQNASSHKYDDGREREFTGHWVVPPGKEENRTLVTQLMRVPYETTVHYIAVHLHPFAESLALRDLTLGETIFESQAENFDGKIGLTRVDFFSSAEGIKIYPDHEYEIVSTYNNTTDKPQDSMAVMYLYLRDLEFEEQILQDSRRAKRFGLS